jgi:hypothetical protein
LRPPQRLGFRAFVAGRGHVHRISMTPLFRARRPSKQSAESPDDPLSRFAQGRVKRNTRAR